MMVYQLTNRDATEVFVNIINILLDVVEVVDDRILRLRTTLPYLCWSVTGDQI